MKQPQYAGFWIRVGSTLIDSVILIFITFPILWMVYGQEYFLGTQMFYGPADLVINYIFPIVITIFLWMKLRGTPGKVMLGLQVVDAKTLGTLSFKQSVIRYFGYFLIILPLGLGCILIAFDKRKQGWHDKLAGSLVIRKQ